VSVLDPQCGDGALVKPFSGYTLKFGIEIDNRVEHVPGVKIIKGNCMKVWELMDELFPELRFICINANPPFGKRWEKADGTVIDSTQATWDFVTKYGNCGFFISNAKTIERLGLDKHPWVGAYEKHENVWQNVTVVVGVVFWKRPIAPGQNWKYSNHEQLDEAWTKLTAIMEEEAQRRPKWNIFLDHAGYLQTYLSVRTELKFKISRENILRLHRVKGCHPLTLTTEKETRDLMSSLVTCGLYSIEPAAKEAIEKALTDMTRQGCPIMPVTDFESVAYADEEEALECIKTVRNAKMQFTAGKTYKITTGTYKFTQKFKRRKPHFNEETRQMFMKDHECTLSGQDRYISVMDDTRSQGATREHIQRDL
jgi:hypothetical protein